MKCTTCHAENPDRAKFCVECGSAFASRCASCSAELPAGAKFCAECGTKVGGAKPAPAPATRETPKHLADKIRQSKAAVEGERKQVTVLFADVKGSMELAESLDPEAFSKIMSRFFAILTEGVERFEGFVDKFTGDGIMALFGAPIAHEDHAQRACYAALHLKDEIARYATELKREHGLSFSTRMGLNSGEVVVGSISEDLRMDYTAQGHTVGLASRMENLAEPNTCFVSANTAALARGYFDLEDLGEFRVKGVANPMRVHRLNGMGTSRTRFDVSRSRGLSRFVGRASDLRTLEDALDQTASGNSQVIGVVAEAGTGKSRLCFEFLERCRAKGMRVFEGRAVAHGRNIPFLPILDVFRSYFGITSDDGDRASREKIAGRMVALNPRFAETLPLLYEFMNVADPKSPPLRLDPDVRQKQLIALMREVTHLSGAEQPIVTMVEDLHWIDAASAQFLEQMVAAQSGARSLLLLNFRPEFRAEWMQGSNYRQIPLTPLGPEAVAELLADLLGKHPSVVALAAPVHARTAGNPFFVEEVAQNLIETGHLQGARGNYKLVTPIDRLEVPVTVKTVLAARIDRLPEREKRVLQTASVIGKDFPEPLLAAVAGLKLDDLKITLANLRRAEFVHELSIYPVTEYSFKHPLTQEVALGSLLTHRRQKLHADLARAIEAQDADHLDERSALLAHHWEEAGETLSAARWHKRAAEWLGVRDFRAATRHWSAARALVRELPGDREAAAIGVHACTQILNFSWRLGDAVVEAKRLLEEGQGYARLLGDQRAHLILSIVYGRVRTSTGDVAEHLEIQQRNNEEASRTNDVVLQAGAAMWLVDALCFAARYTEALAVADDWIKRFPKNLPQSDWLSGLNPFAGVLFWQGYALVMTGRLREGIEKLQYCVDFSASEGTPEIGAYAMGFAAEAHYLAGEADAAMRCARKMEAITHAVGEPAVLIAMCKGAYGFAHLAAQSTGAAMEAARASRLAYQQIERSTRGWAGLALAEAHLQANDLQTALEVAQEAIADCQFSLRRDYEARAHGVVARAVLRRDGAEAREAVEAALANAAALIEASGIKSIEPHFLEWRAELAAALGDQAQRRMLLFQAIKLYEEIDAPMQAERLRGDMT